ncbi:MAG TPA: imelysin family protein [Oligoflexus sp.]|uniref:imelysin family protein n=1 Tax=Oligoflexus sp. TaxID=1971216 RepID=UPI002D7E1B0C|nr:imelysin family protein [Oligoflexus sp.]HET9239406.1 imelysin family protein [Oligoflexus sp.]
MNMRAWVLASVLLAPFFPTAGLKAASREVVLQSYASHVYATYSAASETAGKLQSAVNALIAQPSADNLAAAQRAWLDARVVWGQTEVFRFYEGPIDDASYGVEGMINAWPLDESYIDYVVGAENAGIINQPGKWPTITPELLISLNENGSETNVATGFHAIEFLLWGQDLSATGPGARPYTDYVPGTGKNAERRATYLKAATDLLVKQIAVVKEAWSPGDLNSYGNKFSKQASSEALTKIFKGMYALLTDELAGERMYTGYESQSQEDEHSCFSDNTKTDIVENIRGVLQVWTGDVNGIPGLGADELVSPAMAKFVTGELTTALEAAEALPTPYDSLLMAPEGSEERKVFLETIFMVVDAGTAVKEAAKSLGIPLATN